VPQDYVQAVNWYKKAAEHVPDRGGAGAARSSLGFLYMEGLESDRITVPLHVFCAVKLQREHAMGGGEDDQFANWLKPSARQEKWIQQHPEPQTCAVELVQHNCVQTRRLFVIFGCKTRLLFWGV